MTTGGMLGKGRALEGLAPVVSGCGISSMKERPEGMDFAL